MEAGLIVNNQNGNVVIDSQYSNGVLIKSGIINSSNMIITVNARLPIVFIRPINGEYGSYKVIRLSTTQYRITFYWGQGGEYYIFDVISPEAQKETTGLQVFNEQGNMVFSSNAYYCNFVDAHTFPEIDMDNYWSWRGGYAQLIIHSHSVKESRTGKLAISNSFASRSYQEGAQNYILFIPVYVVEGMVIKMKCAPYNLVDGGYPTDLERNQILVADVGNLPINYDIKTSNK